MISGFSVQSHFKQVTFETTEKNNQHVLAKEQATSGHGEGLSTYAAVVQALTRLSDSEKERLRRKFDIAYLVATENVVFKIPSDL